MLFVINIDNCHNDTTIVRYYDEFKREFLFFSKGMSKEISGVPYLNQLVHACMHEA